MWLKVTNDQECHHGFQYRNGLNVLNDEFNDDIHDQCVAGGFYFSDEKSINFYYCFGVNVRVVDLPTDDPEFRMVQLSNGEYRANRIILKEKYSLLDLATYQKLDIKLPGFIFCVKTGAIELLKHLLQNRIHDPDFDQMLSIASLNGHTCIAKYVLDYFPKNVSEQGRAWAFNHSVRIGNMELAEYLAKMSIETRWLNIASKLVYDDICGQKIEIK